MQPAKALVLGFLAVILVGAFALSLPSSRLDGGIHPMEALFTATSAVCVTGLAVVDTAQAHTTFGEIVILLLLQIGGLGYMTAATAIALVIGREVGVRERVLLREAYGQYALRGMVWLTRKAILFTFIMEFVGAAILTARFATLYGFDWREAASLGVFHSISAFCNAGFDIMGRHYGQFASLSNFAGDAVINLTIAALFIIGGLGFAVMIELYGFRLRRRLSLHSKLVLVITPVLLLVGMFFILLLEWDNPLTLGGLGMGDKTLVSFFQSATARTAGFSTINIAEMRSATLSFMSALMFVGGSTGGTAGGIKTTTFILIILGIWSIVRGKNDVEMFSRRIPVTNVLRALTIAALSALVVVAGTVILTMTEFARVEGAGIPGDPFLNIGFEAFSAFGTVGLSAGVTPHLSPIGRLVIIILMFVGRIGPLTAMAALVSEERRRKGRLPEEHVAIG